MSQTIRIHDIILIWAGLMFGNLAVYLVGLASVTVALPIAIAYTAMAALLVAYSYLHTGKTRRR